MFRRPWSSVSCNRTAARKLRLSLVGKAARKVTPPLGVAAPAPGCLVGKVIFCSDALFEE